MVKIIFGFGQFTTVLMVMGQDKAKLMFLYTGADLLWIETPIPNLKKIASLVAAIRAQVKDFDNFKNTSFPSWLK